MRFLILLFLLCLDVGFGQALFSSFPEQLKKYLELTDQQVSQVVTKNERLVEFRTAKLARQLAVQFEITQETGRATLDAMAIGVRYVEIETIRREIEAESKKTLTEIQTLLTSSQKAKLSMLEEILRQQDTACAAVSWNLMPQPAPQSSLGGFLIGDFSSLGQPFQTGCAIQPRFGSFIPGLIFGNQAQR
jgi:hypothetical protein